MPRKNLTGGVRNCQVRSELFETLLWYGLPRRLSDEESACNARNAGLIPGLRRFPGEEKSNPLQSSCLENPICPFVTGLLSIMSSRFICVIACVRVPLISFFFFFKAEYIPLYVYIIFCLSIHHLMHICVASIFQLLWRTLLWTWVYKNLSPCFQFYSDFPLFFSWFSHGKLCVSRNWFISSSLFNLFTYNCS